MPLWTPEPPPQHSGYTLRIARTPAKGTLRAIITATDVTGVCTHFAKNRTIPCEGTDKCTWCAEGFSWRWHGYVSCILTDTLEHVIFEFSAAASDTFRNYLQLHGTLRGCIFTATRPSQRFNGRVVISCKPSDPQRQRLPDPPNVPKLLCHVWNVQYTPDPGLVARLRDFAQINPNDLGDDGRYRQKQPQTP